MSTATAVSIDTKHNYPLDKLTEEYAAQKCIADEAKRDLEILHKAIIHHPDVEPNLKPTGTATITDTLKVVTGEREKWDQAKLAALASEIDPGFFPFKPEYKKDPAAFKVFCERWPELATKLQAALTTTPAKPRIEVKA